MADIIISPKVKKYEEDLIQLRRDFHAHPELGFQEFRTAKIVADYLIGLGLEVKTGIAGTGVTAVLKAKKEGPTLMLRADMDALPVEEQTDLPFCSVNPGVMHACGHDGHTAMMLIAARVLSERRDEIRGRVKFFFQPNEEDAAAAIAVEEGVLSDPAVDAVVGCHLWASLETGKIAVIPGPLMASSYYFSLKITGKSGHAGQPHTAVNPVARFVEIAQRIQNMLNEEVDAIGEPTVISFCHVEAGTLPTIIPDSILVEGSIRCLHTDAERIHRRFEEIVSAQCAASGCSYDLSLKCGNPLLMNDPEITALEQKIAAGIVGAKNVILDGLQTMLGDDFAELSQRVPGCYMFLGTVDPAKDEIFPHHHPRFDIDERSLPTGVELLVQSAIHYLATIEKR